MNNLKLQCFIYLKLTFFYNVTVDDDAFTKPLLPERRKEPPDQELKPSISIALTTPSRGQLETKTQQSARSKKQVTWSEILTPHRDQQPLIAHKVICGIVVLLLHVLPCYM